MTSKLAKAMLDSCYIAKRASDLQPPLPKGVTPSFIRYLDLIRELESLNKNVKVSDISDHLRLPRPGVTRILKDMEKKGYIKKFCSEEDGRIVYITPTDQGIALSDKYDRDYFEMLVPCLEEIPEEDAVIMIRTIKKLHRIMMESHESGVVSPEEYTVLPDY